MKRVAIVTLILAATTVAAAHDKKAKAKPGPYIFTSKASAKIVKDVIVRASLADGYSLESDHELEFRFTHPAQMPLYGALFMASSACPGMTTKQSWSYSLEERDGTTKVTVQPAWEYPDDYCKNQTSGVTWSQPEEIAAFQKMLDLATNEAAKTPAVARATVAQASNVPAPGGQPVVQTQVVAQDDEARRAQQHQACLDLAKDNPTISCK